MASSDNVYQGFWINWNGGRAAGATLTTQNGAYLVAFLAMLVRIAGNHFWRLLCYFVFHTFRNAKPGEERPWRQQKAILRNSYSPMDAMLRFIGMHSRIERVHF